MSPIEQAIRLNVEWMEANKNHPDAMSYASVAQSTAQLAQIVYGKKETAGDAAVRCLQALKEAEPISLVSTHNCP